MSAINDESLLQEFVTEGREHLSSIEPDLLILEREGENANSDIINRVFRAIHSIKGASGFFGLEALKNLSHSMENLLMMVRDGKMTPNPSVMDPLLVGVDRLNVMLDDIQESESVEYKDIVEQLEYLMANGGAPAPGEKVQLTVAETTTKTTEAETIEFCESALASLSLLNPERLAVDSAIKQGQFLFLIRVYSDVDLEAKNRNPLQFMDSLLSTGTVLDTALDVSAIQDIRSALDVRLPITFLYSSVLEGDLLGLSLDIPENQVVKLKADDVLEGKIEAFDAAQSKSAEPEPEAKPVAQPVAQKEEVPVSKQEEPQPEAPKAEAKKAEKAEKPATASKASADDTVRVKVDLLNKLMDLAGEMVLARNQLVRSVDQDHSGNSALTGIIQNVDLVTSDLQEHIMQTRMQPIASVFGKFPRIVRDLSKQLNKEMELHTSGEEVELDKSILESLSDPLTHLIRNSCDHAMEMPDERVANGKNRCGSIYLRAYQESGHINIAITDDGKGIDHEKIAGSAIKKGLVSESDVKRMSPQDQVNMIFLPGFSTAEKITDVSGRGVGMDVVRTNIEAIGGSISIETEVGIGTTILLSLPLTLAIIPSLVVEVSNETFAIPQINLVELVSVKSSEMMERIGMVGTAPVLKLRGSLLPLVNLANVLDLPQSNKPLPEGVEDERRANGSRRKKQIISDEMVSETEGLMTVSNRRLSEERRKIASFIDPTRDQNILVLKSGHSQYGLIVDDIRDMEEIVVKPLSSFIKCSKCFSGATIMGDGRVSMILDASGIVAASGMSFAEINAERERLESQIATSGYHDSRQSVILFNSASDEVFAVSLSSILRLEKFEMKDVELMGSRRYLPYRGKGLRLVDLNEFLPVAPMNLDTAEAYLIIPKEGDGSFGIMASQIIDTLDTNIVLEKSHIKHTSVNGSAVINGHLTLFIQPKGIFDSLSQEASVHTDEVFNKGSNTAWQPAHLQHSR